MLRKRWKKGAWVILMVAMASALAACGGGSGNGTEQGGAASSLSPSASPHDQTDELTGIIRIDGSSTVFPISMAMAEEFMLKYNNVQITVGESGSSNGFKKLIAGEIEIADASRKIKDGEVEELAAKGEEAIEMPVAYDGITVVINKANDWATEMTVEELKRIWQAGSEVRKWSDVREGWPDEKIKLYGPGTASGTFEYFTEAINGTPKESRTDYVASEDDNTLVRGVANDKYALGYFGYSYYAENTDTLKAVKIKVDEQAPAVEPTFETIRNGTYQPLSRPIFIYPLKSALERPEVKAFIEFYMSEEGQALIEAAQYVPLSQDLYDKNLDYVK